ncbi:GCN5-related N-acetyltransferase [Candidatus Koribacter versatilis Ellin345]|uniref:GCN5-related N-acetyltransferase n=1 Tax=Koribacter versatilis (strain Ellin345) TaxID=204669 RepID=Q1ISP7_KORVE|nr:GNAT family N-acetyltransferase [Candidatus Koribacter versatilis]ABF40103.1 GCN5-related N-acetyltransferase [Candidatus Koribacter versatilis Ellin345]
MHKIATPRLWLIPATVASMKAELRSPRSLSRNLNVRMPKVWPPPPFNDEASQRWMLNYLESHEQSRWGMYYILLRGRDRQLIGNCGFKGEPLKNSIEVGYAICPEFRRHGYAAEAVDRLLRHAFDDPNINRVLAETFPDLIGSIGVLRKNKFVRVRGGSEPGVIRFSHTRARWLAS